MFNHHFKGVEKYTEVLGKIDEEWVKNLMNRVFTEEEKAAIEKANGTPEPQQPSWLSENWLYVVGLRVTR